MWRKSLSITVELLLAIGLAVVASVSVIPFSAGAAALYVVCVVSRLRVRRRSGQQRLAIACAVASAMLFLGIVVTAANYHPSKVVRQQLQRSVTLPSTRTTLGQLAYRATYLREEFPTRMMFIFAEGDKNLTIRFPAHDLTLGQFLQVIETQTGLRHRFMHCGNGYTVLGGSDCCFGLDIRDPRIGSRPPFDVDAYAALQAGEQEPR